MKYYFLVGDQAVSDYPNIDHIDSQDGDVIMYDTETMTPPELMEMASGWGDILQITEEEYRRIYNTILNNNKLY